MDRKIADKNYHYCQQTLALKNQLELGFLEVGERLHKILSEEMYRPNYDTFVDFLEEMKISLPTASKLMNVWVKFVLTFKVKTKLLAEAGGWTKAAEVLPYVQNKEEAETWLIRAKELNQKDLRQELREAKTGIRIDSCDHKGKFETITFRRCVSCGYSERIYAEEK